MEVCVKISQIRKKMDLSQTELALMCDTTQQQIAKIEGAVVDPKLSTLRKIAEALEVEIGDLFYTKREFVEEVNDFLINESSKNKIGLSLLSSLIAKSKRIPSFHPYWEKVKLSAGKIILMEEVR